MRKYEIMYILKADLDETGRQEAIAKLNAILEGKGAKVEKVDESMGLRTLAYEIKKETQGYYVVLKVSAEQEALKEFTRLVSINPVVLRHLIVVDHE